MKTQTLRTRLLSSFLALIAILSVSIGVLGFYQLRNNVFRRAQIVVTNDLKFARSVYQSELEMIKKVFRLTSLRKDPNEIKELAGLDYVFLVTKEDLPAVKSEIVREAFDSGKECGGSRIVTRAELLTMGGTLAEQAAITLQPTPKAIPTKRTVLDKALVIECAMPVNQGRAVLYGGKLINRDFALIDKIHNFIFEDTLYDGKPMGTVTIFLDDTRIATNVLDNAGNRAIGTRVSKTVYENVIGKGKAWLDRAFVVTAWYITGYEPIRNIRGEIIGILYVGLLEQPFMDMLRNIFLVFMLIIGSTTLLAVFFSYILSTAISRPLTDVLEVTKKISSGDLTIKAETRSPLRELNQFAESFNDMAEKISQRDKSIMVSNEKLAALNKSYLNLIGFVSHELKGILSSAILNAYSLRDGFLGMINFKQRKAIDLVTRHLDYLEATVKNFLNLSRIEKGELQIMPRKVLLKEDVIDVAVEGFTKQAGERQMQIINSVAASLEVQADPDLLRIVAHNLIGNAVKYGRQGGTITVTSRVLFDSVEIEVYNDGTPIPLDKKALLFNRFSRIISSETNRVQGTGLGLFITKEIIEKHKGNIWVEPKVSGNSFAFRIAKEV